MLKLDELEVLRAATYEKDRFDKQHPKYQLDKKTYPFLARMKANPEDLQESLLKKLSDKMENDTEINRVIKIDGFTKALHVDAMEQRFLTSRTRVYTTPSYSSMTFIHSSKSNIDYSKLEKERKDYVRKIKDKTKDESDAKKIRVEVGKKKI